jgi:uncharacterized repeat protein (TIGR03803 family)
MSCWLIVRAACALFACFSLAGFSSTSIFAAPQITILHSFQSGASDGAGPRSGVAVLGNKIYGTTLLLGAGQDGVLYSVNTDGTGYQVLHSFSGPDGNQPQSNLIISGSKIFGTAQFGGERDAGTVFSYDTVTSSYQTVYHFQDGFTDGATPMTGFTAVNGTLYTATWQGGSSNAGAIVRLNSDGTGYNLVKSLGGFGTPTPGRGPQGDLIQVGSKLYGTTTAGGAFNKGTIFSYDLNSSSLNYLYSFAGGTADGSSPHGNLALVGNALYGITRRGGAANDGIAFSFDTATSSYSVLHNFLGGTTDGDSPSGGMAVVGSLLYGTAESGGTAGDGVLYTIDPTTNAYNVVYNFNGSPTDGAFPSSDLTTVGNTLLGTTLSGGANSGGTLFAITVPEPSSLVLIALGGYLFSIASIRRRK